MADEREEQQAAPSVQLQRVVDILADLPRHISAAVEAGMGRAIDRISGSGQGGGIGKGFQALPEGAGEAGKGSLKLNGGLTDDEHAEQARIDHDHYRSGGGWNPIASWIGANAQWNLNAGVAKRRHEDAQSKRALSGPGVAEAAGKYGGDLSSFAPPPPAPDEKKPSWPRPGETAQARVAEWARKSGYAPPAAAPGPGLPPAAMPEASAQAKAAARPGPPMPLFLPEKKAPAQDPGGSFGGHTARAAALGIDLTGKAGKPGEAKAAEALEKALDKAKDAANALAAGLDALEKKTKGGGSEATGGAGKDLPPLSEAAKKAAGEDRRM